MRLPSLSHVIAFIALPLVAHAEPVDECDRLAALEADPSAVSEPVAFIWLGICCAIDGSQRGNPSVPGPLVIAHPRAMLAQPKRPFRGVATIPWIMQVIDAVQPLGRHSR